MIQHLKILIRCAFFQKWWWWIYKKFFWCVLHAISRSQPQPFFDQPVKTKQEASEKLVEMSRNDDSTTGILLDYLYHQKFYKLIGIDLSSQTNTIILLQIDFVGKLEDGATMFFMAEKQQKTKLNSKLLFKIINCNRII